MKKLKVLGVCGAQGALLYPIRKYLIGNVEPRAVFHTKKEEQWNINFGDIPFVRTIEPFMNSKPDVIVGSPNCGHSSVFSYSRKKKLGKPKEDACLTLFVNSVIALKPKVFLLENLPKLIDLIPLNEWESYFKNYKLIIHTHSVEVFGNAQTSRKRLIMIGIRTDLEWLYKYFSKTFKVSEEFLVKDIPNLIAPELNYREEGNKKLAMYKYWDKSKTTLTVDQVHELWNSKFKKENKWPMKTLKMKTLPGVYRNRLEAPPLTLRPSNRQFNPEGYPMGLEEFRVIMGFPKKFKVYYEKSNPTYWLNKGRNALSKGAVYEVGLWFKKCLKKAIMDKALV